VRKKYYFTKNIDQSEERNKTSWNTSHNEIEVTKKNYASNNFPSIMVKMLLGHICNV
jgi:hypothetical protein